MGLIESLPVKRARPVLFLPLWLGTLLDRSDYSVPMTYVNSPIWSRSGASDGITGPSDSYFGATPQASIGSISLFYSVDIRRQPDSYFLDKAAGSRFYFRQTTALLRAHVDGVSSQIVADTIGHTSVGVSIPFVGLPEFFMSGSSAGQGADPLSPVILPGEQWRLFGRGSSGIENVVKCMIAYDIPLTTTEMSDLHDWSQDRVTPRKQWYGGGIAGSTEFLSNVQSARVTIADEGSGTLSNTGFTIDSGTWAVTEDSTGKRAIKCTSGAGGTIRHSLVGADGFNTDSFVSSGTVTLSKFADRIKIDALQNGEFTELVLSS